MLSSSNEHSKIQSLFLDVSLASEDANARPIDMEDLQDWRHKVGATVHTGQGSYPECRDRDLWCVVAVALWCVVAVARQSGRGRRHHLTRFPSSQVRSGTESCFLNKGSDILTISTQSWPVVESVLGQIDQCCMDQPPSQTNRQLAIYAS
jgi:hypothetical protein